MAEKSSSVRFVEMTVDLRRAIRSLMHKNNCEDTKLLVSSVPRSSMISRSQSRIKFSPGSVRIFWKKLSEPCCQTDQTQKNTKHSENSPEVHWRYSGKEKSCLHRCCHRKTDSRSGSQNPAQSSRRYRKPAVLSGGQLILLLHFLLYQNTSQKKSAQNFLF